MQTRVIFNPTADHGRANNMIETIKAWCQKNDGLDLVITKEPGHAQQLASEAIASGYRQVFVAGGDGTIHEVVNGLFHQGKALATLGVIPLGSGNDFVSGMGLPVDPQSALATLIEGKSSPLDLALIEDDHERSEVVSNGIGIGFDATISIQTRTITRVHGFAMYALATLRTIAFYYQTPHLEIRFDDEVVEQDALLLAVGVGPRIGGGFHLTPNALADDNLLDSCIVNPVGRLTMLSMLPRVMRGTHITSHHVTMRQSAIINVKSNLPLPVHIDGEIFAYPEDNVKHLTITTLPAALNVIGAKPTKQ